MKWFIALAVVLLGLVPTHAHAAQGIQCDFFDYQSDAQASMDRSIRDYPDLGAQGLDDDGDGIACNQLPARPKEIAKAQSIRGQFEPDFDYIGVEGPAYSARYDVHLGGVRLASDGNAPPNVACADLVTLGDLAVLINLPDGNGRNYYLLSTTRKPLPPGDVDDSTYQVTAAAWIVTDDPSTPVLLNEWLLQEGLAVLDDATVSGKMQVRLEAAQQSAIDQGVGIWGTCNLPDSVSAGQPTATTGAILESSGTGDQIVPFTVESGTTYLMTVTSDGLVFADVYSTAGDWIPGFSISSANGGTYTSAEYLNPGTYYVEMKSNDRWSVVIGTMAS